MATVYINGVKAGCMAIGTTEIANILKGTSDPSSSIGSDGQLYLKYYGNYEKHYFMDNKIVVVENKNDATDLKLYIVGLTKGTSGISITDTDLLAYLSDITSGYLKGCSSYDTADSTTQTGILAIANFGSGLVLHTYIPGWTQYKAGTFYGVIDLTESPVSTQGTPPYQENPFVDPETIVNGGITDSFAKVNDQWQSLIGTDIDAIQSGEGPRIYTNSRYYIGQEQITDISGFTKLYSTDRNIAYGSTGTKVSAALDLTDESTITLNMNDGWSALTSCYYDSENHVGAYGGYSFGEELFIAKTKFWLGRYSEQNKTLTATIQYLDSNGDWHDVATVDITTDLPYPLNIFEVNINNYVYGVRWIHKTVNKTSGNNICFFGMTLYEGSGEYINVYAPESGLNEVPEGYDGFGPILV